MDERKITHREIGSIGAGAQQLLNHIKEKYMGLEFSLSQLRTSAGDPHNFTSSFSELIGKKVSMSGTKETGIKKNEVLFKLIE